MGTDTVMQIVNVIMTSTIHSLASSQEMAANVRQQSWKKALLENLKGLEKNKLVHILFWAILLLCWEKFNTGY